MQTRLFLMVALYLAMQPHTYAGADADRPSPCSVQPTGNSERAMFSSMLAKPNSGTVEIPSSAPAQHRLPHSPRQRQLAEK
jgi:hypothetical protein